MFQYGVKKIIFPESREQSNSPHSIQGQVKSIITPPKGLPLYLPSPPRQIHDGRRQATAPTPQAMQWIWLTYGTGFLCFPCRKFGYSLTIFSKFSASFPHGSCALSVSNIYLALEGIYLLIWAPISKYLTIWGCAPMRVSSMPERESRPLSWPFPRDLAWDNGR